MAEVTLRVVSGSHSFKRDGQNVFVKKGEIFTGEESLLKAFGDKLELVEDAPKKRRGRPRKVETVDHGSESDGDGSQGDSDDQPDGRAD